MVTELQSEQRELADYIRAGSTRGPQCFGSYFDEKGGSCALGAVYDAFYHLRMYETIAARADAGPHERRPSLDARANRRLAHG